MPETDDWTITLNGGQFAVAWLNVALASMPDEDHPTLDRTVLVEVHGDGVQLVATETHVLLVSRVEGDGSPVPPSIDEAPKAVHVAIDADGRMKALMGWLLKDAKAAAKAEVAPPQVTLSIGLATDEATPTLSSDMARRVLVVETERERLDLLLDEGVYPDWRSLLGIGNTYEAAGGVAFAPKFLGLLGKFKGTEHHPVEFTFAGSTGLARFVVRSEPAILGALMPVRVEGE